MLKNPHFAAFDINMTSFDVIWHHVMHWESWSIQYQQNEPNIMSKNLILGSEEQKMYQPIGILQTDRRALPSEGTYGGVSIMQKFNECDFLFIGMSLHNLRGGNHDFRINTDP